MTPQLSELVCKVIEAELLLQVAVDASKEHFQKLGIFPD